MPLYEYECPDCGTRFELLRPVSRRDEATTCPRCGGGRAGRQLSRFVARSGLDSDVLSRAASVASGGGSACASCAAASCAGCK